MLYGTLSDDDDGDDIVAASDSVYDARVLIQAMLKSADSRAAGGMHG